MIGMYTRLRVALAALTGLIAAADSSALAQGALADGRDWPIFRGDPALAGSAPGKLPEKPALRWSFQAGKGITSSPVVAAGRVVFGCDDGQVYCLDAGTGARLWTHATGDVIEAPPLVHGGAVYIGSSDYAFYALDAASGELRWKQETADRILGGANVTSAAGETRILVGSYDSNLYCFAAADGAVRWKYATSNYVNGTPAVLGERVVFGGCDAFLHVVSAASGAGLAKIALGPDAHVAGSAALAGEREPRAYLGHYGNAFVCVDLAKNELAWSYAPGDEPFFSSPAVAGERVVFGGRDRYLHCARASDGQPLWKFPARRKVDSSPVIAGDALVFAALDGRIHVLGLERGEERWSQDLGAEVAASPAVAGGWIFVAALDGHVFAFGPGGEEKE